MVTSPEKQISKLISGSHLLTYRSKQYGFPAQKFLFAFVHKAHKFTAGIAAQGRVQIERQSKLCVPPYIQ